MAKWDAKHISLPGVSLSKPTVLKQARVAYLASSAASSKLHPICKQILCCLSRLVLRRTNTTCQTQSRWYKRARVQKHCLRKAARNEATLRSVACQKIGNAQPLKKTANPKRDRLQHLLLLDSRGCAALEPQVHEICYKVGASPSKPKALGYLYNTALGAPYLARRP